MKGPCQLSRNQRWFFGPFQLDVSQKAASIASRAFYRHEFQKWRFNLEGYLGFSRQSDTNNCFEYTQIFRNGVFEVVDAFNFNTIDDLTKIPSVLYEKTLIKKLKNILEFYPQINIQPSIYVSLAFVDIKGKTLAIDHDYPIDAPIPFDREVISTPEIIIDSFDIDPSLALQPLFDMVWQSVGYSRCGNYDQNGKFSYQL